MPAKQFKFGDKVRFRTSGYEVANLDNPKPAPIVEGVVNGDVMDNYLPVFCNREGREATTVMVHLNNVVED